MFTRALIATACVVTLLPLDAPAQSVGGGVKGGVTLGDLPKLAELVDEPGFDTSLRIGYAAGGFVAVRFAGGLSIQPEVLFTQKGARFDVGESGMTADVKFKADFLDVPVLARYTVGKGVRGYVFGGPSFDFRLNATVDSDILGESEEQDISEDLEAFEFALVFGGGIELGPILLEARWSEGLTDIAKPDPDGPPGDVKTRTYLLLFGFRF